MCVWSHFREGFKKINKDLYLDEAITNNAIRELNDLNPANDSKLFQPTNEFKSFIENLTINDEKDEPHIYHHLIDFDVPNDKIFSFPNERSASYGNESHRPSRPDLVIYEMVYHLLSEN